MKELKTANPTYHYQLIKNKMKEYKIIGTYTVSKSGGTQIISWEVNGKKTKTRNKRCFCF
jgi:hypothetical protein